jgi:type VI secretion system protein ImpE
MSTIEEDVRQGRLDEALVGLQAAIRKAPADPKLRTLLFQLTCMMGRLGSGHDPAQCGGGSGRQGAPMVQTYRTA